jgi:hypothetical protein
VAIDKSIINTYEQERKLNLTKLQLSQRETAIEKEKAKYIQKIYTKQKIKLILIIVGEFLVILILIV